MVKVGDSSGSGGDSGPDTGRDARDKVRDTGHDVYGQLVDDRTSDTGERSVTVTDRNRRPLATAEGTMDVSTYRLSRADAKVGSDGSAGTAKLGADLRAKGVTVDASRVTPIEGESSRRSIGPELEAATRPRGVSPEGKTHAVPDTKAGGDAKASADTTTESRVKSERATRESGDGADEPSYAGDKRARDRSRVELATHAEKRDAGRDLRAEARDERSEQAEARDDRLKRERRDLDRQREKVPKGEVSRRSAEIGRRVNEDAKRTEQDERREGEDSRRDEEDRRRDAADEAWEADDRHRDAEDAVRRREDGVRRTEGREPAASDEERTARSERRATEDVRRGETNAERRHELRLRHQEDERRAKEDLARVSEDKGRDAVDRRRRVEDERWEADKACARDRRREAFLDALPDVLDTAGEGPIPDLPQLPGSGDVIGAVIDVSGEVLRARHGIAAMFRTKMGRWFG